MSAAERTATRQSTDATSFANDARAIIVELMEGLDEGHVDVAMMTSCEAAKLARFTRLLTTVRALEMYANTAEEQGSRIAKVLEVISAERAAAANSDGSTFFSDMRTVLVDVRRHLDDVVSCSDPETNASSIEMNDAAMKLLQAVREAEILLENEERAIEREGDRA